MPLQVLPGRGSGSRLRTVYPWLVVPLLAVILIVGSLTLYLENFAHAASVDTLVPFSGTLPAVLARSKVDGAANPNQIISLSIGLRLRNSGMLNSYLRDVARPGSVNYHRYLTSAQFVGAFSPTQATQDAIVQYLQSSGFTITHTYKHRLLIVFKGTIGQAEQVFHVAINTYTSPQGEIFYSNSTDPQLPTSFVGQVESIGGLNNALHWQHAPVSPHKISKLGKMNANAISCPTAGTGYYLPSQMQAAYNLNGLYTKGYHGEGQTVALFELDTFQPGDISAYASCFGQSRTSIQTVKTGSSPVPTDGGVVEVELDAELVLSTAPKLGTLVIYEAANDTTNYNAEWAQIVQDAPPVVSSSWGLCETDLGRQEAQTEATFLSMAAAQGQSIFVASGDSGSSGCYFDQSSSPSNSLEPQDPASQPYVTAVGGTTLSWDGTTLSESTWNNSASLTPSGASTGGVSVFWPMQSWQSAPGVSNSYSSGTPCGATTGFCREVPDVSLSADPYAGYPIYCTSLAAGCSSGLPWVVVGGTSAAAPMWAAMMALANEESVKSGGFNIGFVDPLLYQIASNSSEYANDFHDVTTGDNDYNSLQGGKYPATANYDLATGLGSFNADHLATDLVALVHSNNGQRLAPASTTWYFPEGAEGGGFQEYLTIQNPDPSQTATVQVTYVFSNQTKVVTHTISPSSRQTFDADVDLGTRPTGPRYNAGAIVKVTSGPAVVVERPIYFNWEGVPSGDDVLGATSTSLSYYFSEADTRQFGQTNYKTYIALLNPGQNTAHLTVTYYTGSCSTNCPTEPVTLGAMQRLAVSPTDVGLHQKLAIAVTSSDNPFVAERPLYFTDNIARAGGLTTGAASVIGATATGNDWLFAEGYTGGGFQEYFELANFGASAAVANVKLEYTDGSTQTIAVNVPAYGFTEFDVNAHQGSHPNSLSAEITTSSSTPIVAQRLMYFHYSGAHISGGTDIVGERGPASHNVYAFAEGYTGGAFSEYLTLQNPTNNNEDVAITFFTPSVVFQLQATVQAHSRKTFNVNNVLNPINQGSVSITVQALPSPGVSNPVIVAERPMYFMYRLAGIGGPAAGGSDVIGFTGS